MRRMMLLAGSVVVGVTGIALVAGCGGGGGAHEPDSASPVPSGKSGSPAAVVLTGRAWRSHGIVVHPWRAELASDETRVFLRIANGSRTRLVIRPEMSGMRPPEGGAVDQVYPVSGNAGYPAVARIVKPGGSTSGVIVFPPINTESWIAFWTVVQSDSLCAGFDGDQVSWALTQDGSPSPAQYDSPCGPTLGE